MEYDPGMSDYRAERVGIVPYEIPGTLALAHATIRQLEEHDVVFWEKHGILAVGEDLISASMRSIR